MKRLLSVCALMVLLSAPAPARACDILRVMGFPESCSFACAAGGNSAYFNTACVWDLATDW